MARIHLSAALIVRNEERFLEACLRSLEGHVDETVIVDTGSTDRSREIARDFGARLIDHPWTGDFACARNRSLDAARGDWILYIDADERLVGFPGDTLDRLSADPAHICYTVLFRPQSGYSRYREYRLFRKRGGLRFRGSIHESLVPALEELCAGGHLRIGDSDVAIDHLGYDGDLTAKHRRNLPMLRARLAHDPNHIYCWDQFGLTLLGLGDRDSAETAWWAAIERIRGSAQPPLAHSLPYLHLASSILDRKGNAGDLLAEGCRRFPENHSLNWLRGRHLIEGGDYRAAMPIFKRLAAIDSTRLAAGALAFDLSIFGAQAHSALGLCAYRIGNLTESARHYARAAKAAPGDLEIRAKSAFIAARAHCGDRD